MNIVKSILEKAGLKKTHIQYFPCSDKKCLVRASCNKLCDKIERDEEKILESFVKLHKCPDCGSEEIYEGPCGGISMNIICAGCNHRFNVSLPFFAERI